MEEELKKLFIEIIKFSKDASPEIWAILIKQQFIWAISGLVGVVISWLSLAFCYSKWQTTKDDYGSYDINPFGMVTAFFVVVVGTATVIFLAELLPRLLNPAYYALMAIKP